MKRPAVFFDRDNTLIVNDGYLGDPAGVKLMPGAAEAVAQARRLGLAVVIFSNQSGVARGLFDEDAVHEVNSRMEALLLAENSAAIIDRHEFCPFHPAGTVEHYRQDSDLRKPGPGMIFNAADALALDLSGSWVIGDAPRDIEAGHAAGCRTILFRPPEVGLSEAAKETEKVRPERVVSTLAEAMDYIQQKRDARSRRDEPAAAQNAVIRAPEIAAHGRQMPAGNVHGAAQTSPPAITAANAPTSTSLSSLVAAVISPAMTTAPVAVGQGVSSDDRSQIKAASSASSTSAASPTLPARVIVPLVTRAAGKATETGKGDVTEPFKMTASADGSGVSPAAAPATGASGAGDTRSTVAAAGQHVQHAPSATAPPRTVEIQNSSARLEMLVEQLLIEVRRRNEQDVTDFSVSKLLAGMVQVIVLAVMFFAYLRRDAVGLQTLLMVAVLLQTLTIALLIMSRQK